MRPLSRVVRTLVVGSAVVMLTGCGMIGGASDSSPPGAGGLEKTTINVGLMSFVDTVPLRRAIDKGYFAAEGLEIKLVPVGKGSQSIEKLISGELHVGLSSYPNALIPQTKNVEQLKIVADAAQTTPDFVMAVVKKGGPITEVRHLEGEKIAVSSLRGISELVMTDQLRIKGVDPKTVTFLSMPIPDMAAALGRGDVAAAVMNQPDLEKARQVQGVTKLFDPFEGPDANFAWSGWLATKKFTEDNPNTVEAFRRGYRKGVADAADRTVVEETSVKHLKIAPEVASLMPVPIYPSTEDADRLQRVADLMAKEGDIPGRKDPAQDGRVVAELDMCTMLLPPAAPASPSASATKSCP